VAGALEEGPLSGQVLAEYFGVSRQAIWKAVQALRAEGMDVVSESGGYRMERGGFGALSLSWHCNRAVVFHSETGSTNRDLFALAMEGAEAGTLVVAERQLAGKGRLGRSWVSTDTKNLSFSLLLRPSLRPDQAPLICLAAAVAIHQITGLGIKWPNDILAPSGGEHGETGAGAKVSGILAELHAEVGHLHFVVLGVGLNVHPQDFPDGILATSLAQALPDRDWDRGRLLGELVDRIETLCYQLQTEPAKVLKAWRAGSVTLGREVRVGQHQGVAVDLREDGALILETPGGRVPILAGDVEMVVTHGTGLAPEKSPPSEWPLS